MSNQLLPRREILTQQPLFLAPILPFWRSKGLVFVHNPAIGDVNLAFNARALNSTVLPKNSGPAGLRLNLAGASKSEFSDAGLAAAGNGLTLISIWRAKDTQYASGDAVRFFLSTRTAGNAGWGWGRISAIAGGATGNLTQQTLVLNGVAQYNETNYTIESLVDTVVACRVKGTTASWFRFGRKSSNDTTVGTASSGGTLVFGAGGPYSGAGNLWNDRAYLTLGFNQPLSDAEIFTLCKDISAPWQVLAPRATLVFIPAGAGGSLNAAASGGGIAAGSASLAAQVALAAVGVSVAGGSAAAAASIPLSAVGFSVSSGSANALAAVTISAAGLAQAAGTANLSGGAAGSISATGQAQASGSALLNITVTLSATGSSQSSGSANLSGGAPGQVSASGGAQAGGSAQIKATVSISAAGYAQAMASGQLSIQIPLSAFGGAISAGSAHLVDAGGSLILTRAPAGQGPIALPADGYRPQQSSQSRPGNTGGRRL